MKVWLCAALLLAVAISAHSIQLESDAASGSLSAAGVASSAEGTSEGTSFLSMERAPKKAAKPSAAPKKKKATAVQKAQTKETLKIAKLEPHQHTPIEYNALGLAPHPKISINATDPDVIALFKSVSTAWGVIRSQSYNTAARAVPGLHTIAFGYDHSSKSPLVTLRFKEGKLPKAVPKALTHSSFKVVTSEKKNNLKFLSGAAPAVPAPAAPKLSPLAPTNSSAIKPKSEKRVPLLTVGDQVDRKRKQKVLGEKSLRKHGSSVGACLQGFTKSKKRGDYFLSSWHDVKKLNKLVTNEFGSKVGVISAVNPKGYRRESDMDVVYMHKKDRCKCTKKVPGYKVFKNRAAFAAAVVFLAKSDAMKRVHLTSNGAGHRRTRKGWINPKRIFESSVVEYPEDEPLKEKKYRVRKASSNRKKGKRKKADKKKGKKADKKKTAKKKGKKAEKKGKKTDKKKGKKAEKKGKKTDKKKGKKAEEKKGKEADQKKGKKTDKKKGKKADNMEAEKKKGKEVEKKEGKKTDKKKGKKADNMEAEKKKGKEAEKKEGKKTDKKKADNMEAEKKKGKEAEKKEGKKTDKKKGKKADNMEAEKKKGKKTDKKKGKKAEKKKGKKAEKKKGKKSDKKKGKKADKKKGKKADKKKGKKKAAKKKGSSEKKKKKTKPRRLRFRGFMRVQYPEEQQPVLRDSGGPLYFHDILVGFASSGDDEGANFSPIWAVNDVLPSHLKHRFC